MPLIVTPYRRWLMQALGLAIFHVVAYGAGGDGGLWLPALGLGLALTSWFGWRYLPLLAVDLFIVRIMIRTSTYPQHPLWLLAIDSLLLTGQIALSWWCYTGPAKGTRWLDDPRSATVFLLLVPGVITAAAACLQALLWTNLAPVEGQSYWPLASALGVSRALGLLTLTPALWVLVTPLLIRGQLLEASPSSQRHVLHRSAARSWGERVELAGLSLGNALLTLALVVQRIEQVNPGWTLWGISILLVVWTSLRQGLRGGILIASIGAVTGLIAAALRHASPAEFNPLQGNLLAQTSTALLVGASSTWIRASEARYRRVVGQIPVILYSVRLPHSIPVITSTGKRPDSKPEVQTGPQIIEQAELTFVSQASKHLFGAEPEALEGPFTNWLTRVHAVDREIVLASLTQLLLQKQPVTCEYRVAPSGEPHLASTNGALTRVTWVRDTLAPHHSDDGRLDGWDGVVEDITEARALSQDVRRTSGMLQALVANLPTGVYFVQGPLGQPILVNARARQLLGQREDLSAGVNHLAKVYRLHRPDGAEYPTEDLPIVKALRWGTISMANDIVVHRPDGRRVPLITWAAPVDLGINSGHPEAAVWVLEDLTSLQQAELARGESEARLRATFESMAEGLLIQDAQGKILECNPAAGAILGVTSKQLIGHHWLENEHTCLRADGAPLPAAELPDRSALRSGQPMRCCILGIQRDGAIHWLQVNCVPLPLRSGLSLANRSARLVTTFTDITAHRQVQDELEQSQRLELIGRLASGTVHDFNNMLTALMGMAAIARGGLDPEHPVRADINRIIDIGEQAANVAGQLLAFSKQRRPLPRPIDINTVVVHTLTILKSVMPAAIEVVTQLAPGDLWILADDTQMKQVVMNLCLNARDAMLQGGTLTVRTTRILAAPSAQGDQGTEPSWINCTIQDTGCGMDEVTVARIFEPFFSTKERGTGLGLAVVQQILQQLGGRIEVSSQPGAGTRFEIWLRECHPPQDWSV